MTHTTSNPSIHEVRNLKRFRELLGIKQEKTFENVLEVKRQKKAEPVIMRVTKLLKPSLRKHSRNLA